MFVLISGKINIILRSGTENICVHMLLWSQAFIHHNHQVPGIKVSWVGELIDSKFFKHSPIEEEYLLYLGCIYENFCFLLKWQEIRMEMETSFPEIMIRWQMMMKSWHHDNLRLSNRPLNVPPLRDTYLFELWGQFDIKLQFYVADLIRANKPDDNWQHWRLVFLNCSNLSSSLNIAEGRALLWARKLCCSNYLLNYPSN